ncbi:MAG: DoxX family protein [Campylobacterota bacterium]|nr:DoxX family protein [Campylobacterota bacterium]
MRDFIGEFRVLLSYPQNIVILLTRLVIAYGFAMPAIMKIDNLENTIIWFTNLGIPLATFMAYFVSAIEGAGIILLILGLFTRYISILMSCVMLGAIFFVHLPHGFSSGNNGFEIPLYYFIFLIIFATFGPGKFSLDQLLFGGGGYE